MRKVLYIYIYIFKATSAPPCAGNSGMYLWGVGVAFANGCTTWYSRKAGNDSPIICLILHPAHIEDRSNTFLSIQMFKQVELTHLCTSRGKSDFHMFVTFHKYRQTQQKKTVGIQSGLRMKQHAVPQQHVQVLLPSNLHVIVRVGGDPPRWWSCNCLKSYGPTHGGNVYIVNTFNIPLQLQRSVDCGGKEFMCQNGHGRCQWLEMVVEQSSNDWEQFNEILFWFGCGGLCAWDHWLLVGHERICPAGLPR